MLFLLLFFLTNIKKNKINNEQIIIGKLIPIARQDFLKMENHYIDELK